MLRRYRDEDLDDVANMDADPEVMRYVGDGHLHDRAEASAMVDRILAHWAAYGFGSWVIERKADHEFLGFCGARYQTFLPEFPRDSTDLGWRLTRAAWDHGYASEAATATIEHAFRDLGFDRLLSLSHPDDVASHGVKERLGMRRMSDLVTTSHGVLRLDRLDRADWLRARALEHGAP
jgi:RimJ/RimL family protein N-acetyltransferase